MARGVLWSFQRMKEETWGCEKYISNINWFKNKFPILIMIIFLGLVWLRPVYNQLFFWIYFSHSIRIIFFKEFSFLERLLYLNSEKVKRKRHITHEKLVHYVWNKGKIVPWKKAQNPKFFPSFGFIEKRKERLFFGGTHAKNFSVILREERRRRHLNGPYFYI
jgi:hypothetical protein